MTRRDWWLGIFAIVASLLVESVFPRYDWRDPGGSNANNYVRIDRWTGTAQWGNFVHLPGRAAGEWVSVEDVRRKRERDRIDAEVDALIREAGDALDAAPDKP